MNPLAGRIALITGSNQGLGKVIAEEYLKAGASVVLCARDRNALMETHKELLPLVHENEVLRYYSIDVSNPQEVNGLKDFVFHHFKKVDILVNNAGIYGPMGPIETVVWEDWKRALEINLFGPVLMSQAFLPHLKNNRYGKIINLSGGGATSPLPNISAYAASKAALVRFTETLALEVKEFNIDVNAIAPGALNTRLLDEVLSAGPEKVGKDFYEKSLRQKAEGGTPFAKGAALCVFLASKASNGLTGKLISAIWDPWMNFPQHSKDLMSSDIYTLRRIVPSDREMNWGNP